ncbi:MAG: hypothetical protein DHS20C01_20460 [marine bacterium B5-7]|nr:MAG: hypothetical protein DHS20C01_20460 [marine bacterium B5-7]
MKIGLVLGSGAARGNAHIGVLNALADMGVRPDIICGCSIGALVGASYAAGKLDRLEKWMRTLSRRSMLRYFELNPFGGSLISNTEFDGFLSREVCEEECLIKSLDITFAAVATELKSGDEICLDSGSVLDAVRASIALPGLFRPVRHPDGWLVDGGLVNPVPVSICRALGADIVIAVNLNADIVGKHFASKMTDTTMQSTDNGRRRQQAVIPPEVVTWPSRINTTVNSWLDDVFSLRGDDAGEPSKDDPPGLMDTVASALNIMQDRITSSRLTEDPADIVLSPRLSSIGLMEFYRADRAIAEGEASVNRMMNEIKYALGGDTGNSHMTPDNSKDAD